MFCEISIYLARWDKWINQRKLVFILLYSKCIRPVSKLMWHMVFIDIDRLMPYGWLLYLISIDISITLFLILPWNIMLLFVKFHSVIPCTCTSFISTLTRTLSYKERKYWKLKDHIRNKIRAKCYVSIWK